MKTCTKCKETKNLVDFGKALKNRDGLKNACKGCTRSYNNSMLPIRRVQARLRKYGLADERYNKMLKDQNNECAICFQDLDKVRAVVDHCHETKEVRGILCSKCNIGIGQFEDCPELLQSAIWYLTDWGEDFEEECLN